VLLWSLSVKMVVELVFGVPAVGVKDSASRSIATADAEPDSV
jgi:hypothetical protein